ncbi:MAG TPA: NosD domain-containing protein [Nitrososphaera sp.]
MRRLAEYKDSRLTITLGALALVILSSIVAMISIFNKQQEQEQEEISSQDNYGLITSTDRLLNYVKGYARIALTALDHSEHQTFTAVVANAANSSASNNKNNNIADNNNANNNTGKEKENNDADDNNNSNNSNRPPILASCGQILTENAILSNDLKCTGIGMIVDKDGITIQLNNHKLLSLTNNSNTNSTKIPELESIGILIPNANNVTIVGPGVIAGFNKAIEFAGSESGRVLDLKLADNKIGVLLKASNDIGIYSTSIEGNAIGIASQSSRGGKINFNQIFQNTDQGIVLMDSDYFIINSNSVIGNGDNGIFLDIQSFNNTLSYNNLFNQTAIDINNANGVPLDILSNRFVENNCRKTEPVGLCY